MKIDFVTVRVSDLERSIEFYRRALGMEVARRFSPGPGMEIAFLSGGGAELELIRDDKAAPFAGSGISLGFHVADMERTLAHLKENGVEILRGPLAMKGGVKLLSARDPNGLELGFVQQP
jgi:lactoylglutathione lyase